MCVCTCGNRLDSILNQDTQNEPFFLGALREVGFLLGAFREVGFLLGAFLKLGFFTCVFGLEGFFCGGILPEP